MAAGGEVAVGINHVAQVDALGDDFLGIEVVQVHAVAQLVHLRRGLGAKAAGGGELKVIAGHVGVAINLEWPVGAAAQTHGRALEVAHRRIQVDGEHVGQVGTRGNGYK